MIRFVWTILFVLGLISKSTGQNSDKRTADSIVIALKSYHLDQALKNINTLKKEELKNAFLFQWNYYKNGIFIDKLLVSNDFLKRNRESIINDYSLGEYYKRKKQPNDSLAYINYKNAFEDALNLKDTILVNMVLPKLLDHLFDYHETNLNELKKYQGFLNEFARDNVDHFWNRYFDIVIKLSEYEKQKDTKQLPDITFKQLYHFAESTPYLSGRAHQFEGVYQNYFVKDYKKGEHHFKKAIGFYEKGSSYVSKRRVSGNRINLGIYLFNKEKYKEAIPFFRKEFNNDYDDTNLIEEFRINEWMYRCYDILQINDSAYFYFKRMSILKDKLDRINYAADIVEIENKYDFVKREKELKLIMEKETKRINTQLQTIIPILGGVILALIFIFYLYKRYKKKSSILEEEQSETLQKLDELKSIVIKNHIVLKDKTKVYVSDLMYIKSDDHYLNVFTSDDKNHFVRGKLSQIKEELPPNFVQCHRSYIVNANFIKQVNSTSIVLINKMQIPLSRTYKKKF